MSDLFNLIPSQTHEQQQLASNPNLSAWVSANAGSGKTHVLANRVVRLLLKGINPTRILALTFTKTAAGEMAKRVFKTLGDWSVMSDDELRKQIERLQNEPVKAGDLLHARTLFARSLETPGGLKIQTIHAFCEALLHQFPLEANVAGNFSVLDPADEAGLMEQARRRVIVQAESGKAPHLADAFAAMMAYATDYAIDNVMSELVARREEVLGWLDLHGGALAAEQTARRNMNFGPDETVEVAQQNLRNLMSINTATWQEVRFAIPDNAATREAELAQKIDRLGSDDFSVRFAAIQDILLTGSGSARKESTIVSKRLGDQFPGLRDKMLEDADTFIAGLMRINTLTQIIETRNLMVLGEAMLHRYRALKRARGQLDFNDLIARTADLLLRKEARAWVLYKLDLGIDHVLLDEAQDTSPQQWSIVNALVEEFFSGIGASQAHRTVFAVGDEKQSIYSFQGARPESFSQQRRSFERQALHANKRFESASLSLSFRSTPDVLKAVDTVFNIPANAEGLTADNTNDPHTTLRTNAPGRVEVWQKFEAVDPDIPLEWTASMEAEQEAHQAVRLAALVAKQIENWIDTGERISPRKLEGGSRPINAGDILVLVRSRDTFIPALTRALKERAVPVAGTDRLAITDHIAVKDLMALGRVMLTPQDDLSLASLLRSPLFEISENDLMDLAVNRNDDMTLFEALELHSVDAPYDIAFGKLTGWMSQADQVPVYEFYARILGDGRGRKSLYSRLGQESEDVLDAFLALALKHEQSGLPGLHGFLQQLETGNAELKRELAEGRGEVRVMTVHAAKGQEAPIVFLVDKSAEAYIAQHRPALYLTGPTQRPDQTSFLWAPKKSDHGAESALSEDQVKRLAEQEYRRLLYVAMTRAEDRLIVCGYKSSKPTPALNWHTMVESALDGELETQESLDPDIAVRRMNPAVKIDPIQPNAKQDSPSPLTEKPAPTAPPAWLKHRLPKERALPRPLSPSGAQALIDEQLTQDAVFPSVLDHGDLTAEPQSTFARRRGTAIHKLLQVWPDLERETVEEKALTYLRTVLGEASEHQVASIIQTVQSVMDNPKLAPYFDPALSRAEMPVMGRIDLASGPRPVSGTIDRLAVCNDHVMLLDYKTSPYPPESAQVAPPDYVTQMALYRALVQRIYPEKDVQAALVWTHAPEGPRFMPLAADQLDAALATLTAL